MHERYSAEAFEGELTIPRESRLGNKAITANMDTRESDKAISAEEKSTANLRQVLKDPLEKAIADLVKEREAANTAREQAANEAYNVDEMFSVNFGE